jgi:biopolymer transport protein ExbD
VKTKWIVVLLFALGAILALAHHRFRERRAASSTPESRTPSSIEEATDACVSNSESQRIVVLHVASSSLSINSEPVGNGQLPQRLREIYRTRPERVLYLLPDKDASFQRISDLVHVVQHLRPESASERPVPKELKRPMDDLMNIHVRLVTARAINAPCPKNYFNWANQGLPVYP